ncbi:MAG: riboflavin kinase [Bifidobacterium sp.]|uniref:riboflavin kinase n=1 Tax=Bifidobacterium sp. TaxID=41200 RepID=UPI0039EC7762
MRISRLTPDESGIVPWPTLSVSKKAVVTVGVFDGMHRGHTELLERVKALAEQQRAYSVVIMFDPRPGVVHHFVKEHDGMEPTADDLAVDSQALMSVDERVHRMAQLGIDHVLIVAYNLAFAAKSYRFFLGQLVGKVGMRTLVLGSDAEMGSNRAGDVEAIQRLAEATGVFQLDVVGDVGPGYTRVPRIIEPQAPEQAGEPDDPLLHMTKDEQRAWSKSHDAAKVRVWSSTNVRYLLSQGRMAEANEVLGHDHVIEGQVVHGEQRGRDLGFPTANLGEPVGGYIPVDGVYAGWLVDLGKRDKVLDGYEEEDSAAISQANVDARVSPGSPWRWPAAISIGTKETYESQTGLRHRVVEAYAMSKEWLDLYDHDVRIEFTNFLRPQVKFDGSDQLVDQLRKDEQSALKLLGA